MLHSPAGGASAMVASEDAGGAGEGWGEDAELIIDEGKLFVTLLCTSGDSSVCL